MEGKINISICQMIVGNDKQDNLQRAAEMMAKSVKRGTDMIILPEVFNAPYDVSLFPAYAEPYPGLTTNFLAQQAEQHAVCVVGGSILEKDDCGNIYNSSFVFDDNGELIGKHRKVHLFNIDIPQAITFRESAVLSAGNTATVLKYKSVCFGLMICFDCRFPELARATVLEGAEVLIIPAAFNLTTGPAHWELLMRTRAIDNQVFVLAASPARNTEGSYKAWGHSMVVDPWGAILAEAAAEEEILQVELDLSLVSKIRRELPLIKERRSDVYELRY